MRRTLLVALALAGATLACRGGRGTPVRTAAHHRVEIRGLAFIPDTLTVSAGDTITWTNRDVVPHTVTASSSTPEPGSGAGGARSPTASSGRLDEGDTFTFVVPPDSPSASYACDFHPLMQGWVLAAHAAGRAGTE